MKIEKILNNNAIICIDEKDREVIVRGKGIAYHCKAGDQVNESLIEKIYRLDTGVGSQLSKLIARIPISYWEISEKIIQYAKIVLRKQINDMIYLSLTDHIAMAAERCQEGIYLPNPLLFEIRRFYPDEYRIGLYALDLIRETEGIELKEDEAGFIAIHIINAQAGDGEEIAYETTNLIAEVLKIIRLRFNIIFKEDTISYYRFITHLKYFARRVIQKGQFHDNVDDDLLPIIQDKYSGSYECVRYIAKLLLQLKDYRLSESEKIYLTIHIEKVVAEARGEVGNMGS